MGLKMSCPIENCIKEEEQVLSCCSEAFLFGNGTEADGAFTPNEHMETFGRSGDSEIVRWRTSPCWVVYERAFLCWFKSTAHWKKGSVLLLLVKKLQQPACKASLLMEAGL